MINEEFAKYLKDNPAFSRFMLLWINKYEKMERIGGTILMPKPDDMEREAIGGLMGKDFSSCTVIRISYQELLKALQSTKFACCDFLKVCELYQENKLISNKQKRQRESDEFNFYIDTLMSKYKNTPIEKWLIKIIEEAGGYLGVFKKAFRANDIEYIDITLNALNHLPAFRQKISTLSVFANQMSKNPHYFDEGRARNMLIDGIIFLLGIHSKPDSLEELNLLLYQAGIVKDDLSNHCMIFRINAYDNYNHYHRAWNGFYQNYEMWNVSLYNMQQTNKLCGIEKVYIVENPSIFRSLCLAIKEIKNDKIGLLCIEGQPNLCAYLIMDQLEKQSIPMYYNGDFDPEGLLIADKLNRRYFSLSLWHYAKEDYLISKSNILVSERRLAMLRQCRSSELQTIIALLIESKESGYQESLEMLCVEEFKKL